MTTQMGQLQYTRNFKMARAKKDYKALNIKIESTIYERLENYAEEKGQTKTKAVERLLTKAMDLEEKDDK